MTTAPLLDEGTSGRRVSTVVRAQAARTVADFLRAPPAWAILTGILAAGAWHAHLREGNRLAMPAAFAR